ncbi:MAG TPA: three-Cys-motif partner protein TcmP [Verrucomicrobiae bacterium]|nr:three-Cys-motif partner protein TcmP [Verrucomicrobiae bacterium]
MNDEKLLIDVPQNKVTKEKKFKERTPIWTGCKAKLIERYLYYFVQITHNGTYIDGFAGPQKIGKEDMWAAKLVLESRPRWFRNFHLFELNQKSIGLLEKLRDGQPPPDKLKREPKRRVEIYPGDFNVNIGAALKASPIADKEASFCLLDQRTLECNWESVNTVATHKKGGSKIELYYFFPEGWINRTIHALKYDRDKKLETWWGDSSWKELLTVQGAERADLVVKRFKNKFGYKNVNPFAIYERPYGRGRVMYYMIHASDHDAAPVLMNRAYGKALDIIEPPEQLGFLDTFLPAKVPDKI